MAEKKIAGKNAKKLPKTVQQKLDAFAEIYYDLKALGEEKTKLQERVLKELASRGLRGALTTDQEQVETVTQSRKPVTKAQLVEFFGEKKATQFWDKLEKKSSTWLTVVNPTPEKRKQMIKERMLARVV